METSGDGKSGGKLCRLASAVNASKQILPHTSASSAEARRMTTDSSPECMTCDCPAMLVLPSPKSRRQLRNAISATARLIVQLLDDRYSDQRAILARNHAPAGKSVGWSGDAGPSPPFFV